jgi:uncharacterized membrane protein YcaP (DUF421 family)
MDAVWRALAIYFVLLIVFRASGKRSIGQITTFDFVLLLIIGEATQQALIGEDFSITRGVVLIATLLSVDLVFSLLKDRVPWLDHAIDSRPLVVLEHGQPMRDRMSKERIDEEDILEAARQAHGLERLDQIKLAVLERSGAISIIPQRDQRS